MESLLVPQEFTFHTFSLFGLTEGNVLQITVLQSIVRDCGRVEILESKTIRPKRDFSDLVLQHVYF